MKNVATLDDLIDRHPLPVGAADKMRQLGFARAVDESCYNDKMSRSTAEAMKPWLLDALCKERDAYTEKHLWDRLPPDAQVIAMKSLCGLLSIEELLHALHNHPNMHVRSWAALRLSWIDERRCLVIEKNSADKAPPFIGGSSVRSQVFEVVVRQAIAGAPWRMICAGPMQVNDIADEEVVHEMFQRELNKYNDAARGRVSVPQRYPVSIQEYASMWRSVAAVCQAMLEWQAHASMDDLWQTPSAPECTRLFALATVRSSDDRTDRQDTMAIFSRWIDRISDPHTDEAAAEATLLRWYDAWGAKRPAKITWVESPKDALEVVRTEGLTLLQYVGPCIGALRRFANSSIDELQRSAAIGNALLRSLTGDRVTLFQAAEDPAWSLSNVASRGQLDVPLLVALERTHAVADFDYCSIILEAAKSCGFWWSFRDDLIISRKPQRVEIDERYRPHSLSGPAVQYKNWELYFVRGTAVPPWVVQEPDKITIAKIDETTNVEVRRVLIELYGIDRYIMDSGATIRHASPRGVLLVKNLLGDEPIVMIKVINSTPEPDGTFKEYFLRVPPNMQTVEDALAWTFALDASEVYAPSRET